MRHIATAVATTVLLLTSVSAGQQYRSADWNQLRRRILTDQSCNLGGQHGVPPNAARHTRVPSVPPNLAERQQRVREIACRADVDPALALALIQHESAFDDPL